MWRSACIYSRNRSAVDSVKPLEGLAGMMAPHPNRTLSITTIFSALLASQERHTTGRELK